MHITTQRARIDSRTDVVFRWDGRDIHAEWAPSMPRPLSSLKLTRYRKARDRFISTVVAPAVRGTVAVVDLPA